MSNLRTIFWLTVLTLAAVAANVFVAWQSPTTKVLPNRTLMDPGFRAERITLSRPGASDTVLLKGVRWSLERPYAGAADAQVIMRLLDTLMTTSVGSVLSEAEQVKLGKHLGDFGLETPDLRLVVSGPSGEVSLSFGALTPASNGVYVATSDSASVLVVPLTVREVTNLQPEAFRERDVFPYEPEFILGFDLRKTGESPVTFERTGDGWSVGNATASSAKIRAFLEQLTAVSAIDFCWPVGATNEGTVASEALLVGYGLDSGASVSIGLRCRDGIDRRISFGNDVGEGRAYALIHNGGAIVSVDVAIKNAVLEGIRTFEDGRLFSAEAGSVASFTLQAGETSYVLARGADDSWRLDAPVSAPADSEVASALLGRLLALTSADIVNEGLGVSISTNGTSFIVTPKAVLGDYRMEDLRSRDILRVDPTLVKRIVSTPGGRHAAPPVSVVYSRERRSWSVETEGDSVASVEEDAVADIIAALSPLKAEQIVALKVSAEDLSRYGLEQPSHTLSVDQEKEGAVRRNVFIGNETKGGRFATVGSSEAIFILPTKTVSVLTAPLLAD